MTGVVRSVGAIAWATLLQTLRSRVLGISVLFAVVLVALSVAAASVSFGDRGRLIIDVGLGAASGIGTLIAVALTVISFATELDRHTAYPVLARPLPRAAFVLGKYVGVVAAMELVVLVMVLATALTVWLAGGDVATAFWGSVWLCLVEMTLVVALALLFSSITVPPLAAAYTGGVIIAGNLAADMLAFAEKLESKGEALGTVLRGFYYLVPDLEKLSLRTQAANSLPLPWDYLLLGTLYGLTYAAATLVLTTWIFSRRKAV